MIIPNLCDYIKLIQVLYLLNIWIIRFFLSFYFTILLFRYSLTMPFLECLILIYYTISVCVKFVVAWTAHTKKMCYMHRKSLCKSLQPTIERERQRGEMYDWRDKEEEKEKKFFWQPKCVIFLSNFCLLFIYLLLFFYIIVQFMVVILTNQSIDSLICFRSIILIN